MKLSVIVPFYNVEPFLGPCLESLIRQTCADFEVVMVDDGSFDGSALIAKDFAARDPRFRLVRQETQGPGPARNHGLDVAEGDYVAFADADDLVAPDGYAVLLDSLRATGSDVACGNAWRFDERGVRPSAAHRKPFQETLLSTHIEKHPGLVADRMVWNKIYRRSLFETHGLRFPSGLYEDGPVAMAAHVLARSVDVLHQRMYYWRDRRTGDMSITQRFTEQSNLTDRLASVRGIVDFLDEHAPTLRPAFDRYTLDVDIPALFKALHHTPPADHPAMLELAIGFLDSVTPSVFAEIDPYMRLCCHLALRRMLPELLELLVDEPPVIQRLRHGRYLDLPYLGDKARAIPDEVYAANGEIRLYARIDDVSWQRGRLRAEGHAYLRCVPMGPESQIRVALCHERSGTEVELPVTRVDRPDVTTESRQSAVPYDRSGFVVEVDPAKLRIRHRSTGIGDWTWKVTVRAGGHRRSGTVEHMAEGRAWWLDSATFGSVWARHTDIGGRVPGLRLSRPSAILTGYRLDAGVIQLNGRFTRTDSDDTVARLMLTRDDGEELEYPVSLGPPAEDGRVFHCRVPVTALVTPLDVIHRETHALLIGEGMRYGVRLAVGQGRHAITLSPDVPYGHLTFGDREIRLTTSQYGNLSVIERITRPTVTSWAAADGRLAITGEYAGPRPDALILRRHDPRVNQAIPLTWDGTTFTASLEPPPGPADNWWLLVETGAGEVSVVADRSLLTKARPTVGGTALGAVKGDTVVLRVRYVPLSG